MKGIFYLIFQGILCKLGKHDFVFQAGKATLGYNYLTCAYCGRGQRL